MTVLRGQTATIGTGNFTKIREKEKNNFMVEVSEVDLKNVFLLPLFNSAVFWRPSRSAASDREHFLKI